MPDHVPEFAATPDSSRGPRIGMPPENRRQMLVKSGWMLMWMAYIAYPVSNLVSGGHRPLAAALGWLALLAYLAVYVPLVLARTTFQRHGVRGVPPALAFMLVLSEVTVVCYGGDWTSLFIYTSVAAGAVLPLRHGLRGVLLITLLLLGTAYAAGVDQSSILVLALSSFLGGASMTGLQSLIATMRELRQARETISHLAANEERLRLARDLHDLLGHSLSLITLKSELAGRFLDQDREADARTQVAEIEQVSRQALADVREAVGGYRRARLVVELAAARTAFSAAKVRLEVEQGLSGGDLPPELAPEEEGALAWALREAVTNVIRHSGAENCSVRLERVLDEGGAQALCLEVTDDGRGPGRSAPGNGLSGLTERLALVDGGLDASAGPDGRGFRLRATVPLRPEARRLGSPSGGAPDTVHG
jgi:two-component system sensor histidine kinase DesK